MIQRLIVAEAKRRMDVKREAEAQAAPEPEKRERKKPRLTPEERMRRSQHIRAINAKRWGNGSGVDPTAH